MAWIPRTRPWRFSNDSPTILQRFSNDSRSTEVSTRGGKRRVNFVWGDGFLEMVETLRRLVVQVISADWRILDDGERILRRGWSVEREGAWPVGTTWRAPANSVVARVYRYISPLLTGLFAALHLFSICFQHDGFLLLLHRLAFSIFYRLFPFVGNNNDGPGLFTASQK